MKIGVFFGSFNPIHCAHVSIAERFLNELDVEQVWLSVSPQNPWKEAHGLAAMTHRVKMAQLAVAKQEDIKVVCFEKDLPQPSYTYESLLFLKEKHPEHEFVLLIGGDNCELFDQWRNYDKILQQFEVYAYPRNRTNIKKELAQQMKIIDAPLIDLASTDIRSLIQQKGTIKGVPSLVLAYIEENNLYLK